MTTSPAAALETGARYVAANRPGARASGLQEDNQDYLVELEMIEDGMPFPIGWAFIFVNKKTGRIWTAAPGLGFDKMVKMSPVTAAS